MLRGVVLVLILLEGAARADDCLIKARQAVAASSYTAAHAALAAARSSGTCGPAESAELYKLSGIVEAALGNPEAATQAFKRLLALSPGATLPAGTSPRIRRPFDAAAAATPAPLEIQVEAGRPPGAFTVVVTDPMALVDKVRLRYTIDGGAERTREIASAPRAAIALPAGKRTEVRLIALDAHGNRLVEREPWVHIHEPAPVVVSRPLPPPPRPVQRPIYLRWWPYAVATIAAGGATTYFGWSAYSTARDLQGAGNDVEARALEDRGRRQTLFTNIGFGVTGAFAIATGVLFVLRPGGTETRLSAVPVPDGGAMVFAGRSW
jgi:hypothetical protein